MAEVKKVEPKKDDLDKKVNSLAAQLRKVISALEKQFGVDIDGDGKVGAARAIFGAFFLVCLIAGVSMAASIVKWYDGDSTFGTAKIDGSGGAATLTVDNIAVSLLNSAPTSLSVTNGQAVTVAKSCYLVSGIGSPNDNTNTVTLVNPSAAGDVVTLIMAAGTTNLVTIADSGNVAASGAILLDANDAVTLQAATTGLWVEVSASDN